MLNQFIIVLIQWKLPISDASVLGGLSRSFAPLYFKVKEVNEVMSTEQPCDVAYEFGTGLLDLQEYPKGFPKPGKTFIHNMHIKSISFFVMVKVLCISRETSVTVWWWGCNICTACRPWCCGRTSMARGSRPKAST